MINKNTVNHGDCLEIMQSIEDKSIDMILCDLPYGSTDNQWDTVIPSHKLWMQYERIIKDNGAIILTSQLPFMTDLIISNRKLFRYEWIWIKNKATGFLNAKKMPLKAHENVLVFYKNLPTYNAQGLVKVKVKVKVKDTGSNYLTHNKEHIVDTENYPKDILYYDIDMKEQLHPTQKPVALFEYLIKTYTNEGDTVLDNCAGSGTTGLACLRTNRNYILIEQEEKYIEIINNRINKFNCVEEANHKSNEVQPCLEFE